MNMSQNIDKLVPALIAVKSQLRTVTKSAKNPFFKSNYADLNSHLEVVEPLLAENGLVLLQPTGIHPQTGKGTVSSILLHTSGQYITSVMELSSKDMTDPQKLGSSVTYMRRYTLGALLGMQAADDDGNAGAGKTKKELPETIKQTFYGIETTVSTPQVSVVSGTNNNHAVSVFTNTNLADNAATPVPTKRSSFRKSTPVVTNDDI